MSAHEPKDYHLAKRAYEAYHREQPQVWFEDLSHDYQMRWVYVVREVVKERGRQAVHTKPASTRRHIVDRITSKQEAEDVLKGVPIKANGRRDYSGMPIIEKRKAQNAIRYLTVHKR